MAKEVRVTSVEGFIHELAKCHLETGRVRFFRGGMPTTKGTGSALESIERAI